MNADDIRGLLSSKRGREFWACLEGLSGTAEFGDFLRREFPRETAAWGEAIGRRDFLAILGASLALAGLGGCSKPPPEKIVPYVRTPEDVVPGKPLSYATAMPLAGAGTGLLVRSVMGRPIKVEGNPDHPGSLGGTDAFAQAAVYSLYDPDRSQSVVKSGRISTWGDFAAAAGAAMTDHRKKKGAGLRVLTESVASPTLSRQLRELLSEFPEARWHAFEPLEDRSAREGARLAFGEPFAHHYKLERADVLLCLDADLFASGPGGLRYAHDFVERRRAGFTGSRPNRLYVAESTPSITGAMADHRWPVRSCDIVRVARGLARKLGLPAGGEADLSASPWVEAVARDLRRHSGASVVAAGPGQPAEVHALALAMNHALGNVGRTVVMTNSPESDSGRAPEPLGPLAEDMKAGKVDTLIILGGNPVYTAPADVDFGARLAKVPLRIHLAAYEDETSRLCHWHVPEAHFLETWSDVRAFDGTVSIVQPLIRPLYGGKSVHEVVSLLDARAARNGREIIRDTWRERHPETFEAFWERALHDGVVAGTAWAERPVNLRTDWMRSEPPAPVAAGMMEVVFRPDPSTWDGRFANNAWLQELPKPLSKITWENAAFLSPATAGRLGLANEDLVELHFRGRTVVAPIWVMPGHAENSVTLPLGYGRSRAGRAGSGLGFNAYLLRSSDAGFGAGLEIRKLGERHPIACTQAHRAIEGRDLVRSGSIREFRENPHAWGRPQGGEEKPPSLYPEHPYPGNAWGMVIDLGACTGCNACVLACQAENNIPVVGKSEVLRGREMHWLRVDQYDAGRPAHPETIHQPVPCMHCENAPCELVCPVAATTHSAEGLNQMVYNRCVGTRYCSNNCPYKVRRFNFFQYADAESPSQKLLRNPDVSVRERGVMEKCTYCVQRIVAVRIESEKGERPIRDGEVVTACQAACPTGAIVFGNLNDPESRVAWLRQSPLNYGLLEELNTRPRTTYLARVRNPNPDLEGA